MNEPPESNITVCLWVSEVMVTVPSFMNPSYRLTRVDQVSLLFPQGVQLPLLLPLHLLQLSLQLLHSLLTIHNTIPISVDRHATSSPQKKSRLLYLIHLAGPGFLLNLHYEVMSCWVNIAACCWDWSPRPRHNANQTSNLQVNERHERDTWQRGWE